MKMVKKVDGFSATLCPTQENFKGGVTSVNEGWKAPQPSCHLRNLGI